MYNVQLDEFNNGWFRNSTELKNVTHKQILHFFRQDELREIINLPEESVINNEINAYGTFEIIFTNYSETFVIYISKNA